MQTPLSQMIEQLSREKNVDSKVIITALEDAMVAAARKYFGTDEDFHSHYIPENGIIEVYAVKRVVDKVTNPSLEVSLQEAADIDETLQINDTVEIPKPTDALGRIAAQTAKQVIYQKVHEAERDLIHKEYGKRVLEMVTGIVKRFEGPAERDVILDIDKVEALLPYREQAKGEKLKLNERVKVLIVRIARSIKEPQVIVSRAHPTLLVRLFEVEVPEIREGTVLIKGIAREAGERTKIAVASTNRDIDPVGACVGIKGVRINAVARELKDERIDVVHWSEDSAIFAANALSPAKPSKVIVLDSAKKVFEIILEKSQLSLAIGKKGQNVRLASRLVGWEINVKSDEEKKREVKESIDQITSSERQPVESVPEKVNEPVKEEVNESEAHQVQSEE